MIEDLNWKSLEDRRKIAKLTMMYKLVNGLVLVNTEDRLIPPDRIFRIYSKPFQMFLFSPECGHHQFVDYSASFWMCMQKKYYTEFEFLKCFTYIQ
jgi:hypothetical protein